MRGVLAPPVVVVGAVQSSERVVDQAQATRRVRGISVYRQRAGRTRGQQQALEAVNGLDITTL